jgi:hypothetical protein
MDWIETLVENLNDQYKHQTSRDLPWMSKMEVGKAIYWAEKNTRQEGQVDPATKVN